MEDDGSQWDSPMLHIDVVPGWITVHYNPDGDSDDQVWAIDQSRDRIWLTDSELDQVMAAAVAARTRRGVEDDVVVDDDLKPVTATIRWWFQPLSSECWFDIELSCGTRPERESILDLMRQINESDANVTMTIADSASGGGRGAWPIKAASRRESWHPV